MAAAAEAEEVAALRASLCPCDLPHCPTAPACQQTHRGFVDAAAGRPHRTRRALHVQSGGLKPPQAPHPHPQNSLQQPPRKSTKTPLKPCTSQTPHGPHIAQQGLAAHRPAPEANAIRACCGARRARHGPFRRTEAAPRLCRVLR